MKNGISLGHQLLIRALLIFLCLFSSSFTFSAIPDEYTLKLVYLYNFTKFINWGADTTQSTEEPFHICVIGKLPSSEPLNVLQTKRSQNRPITTGRYQADSETQDCHILFITKSIRRNELNRILEQPHEDTIVVGESSDFAREKGDIGFVIDDKQHVRLEINLGNTHRKNVTIRAPLLEIASKIYRQEDKG